MKQSKINSLIEQVANIGTGFFLSMAVWAYCVNPLIKNGYMSIDDTFNITMIFTITSFIRGYVWRRVFNHFHWKKYNDVTRKNKGRSKDCHERERCHQEDTTDYPNW